jgi:hypothetical protein
VEISQRLPFLSWLQHQPSLANALYLSQGHFFTRLIEGLAQLQAPIVSKTLKATPHETLLAPLKPCPFRLYRNSNDRQKTDNFPQSRVLRRNPSVRKRPSGESWADGMKEDPKHKPLKQDQLVSGRLDWTCQFGTLGQFIKCPRAGLAPLPDGVDVDHAAALGTTALTAYQSLVRYVKEGNRIKSLGADEVVDYTACNLSETLKARGEVFDLLVDNVSKPHDLYKVSDHFLKKGVPFVQLAAADDSLQSALSMLPRLLLPSFLG